MNNLARAKFLQGEVAEAIPLYEAAVAAAPALAEPRRWLAIADLMAGNTPAALSQLERAVELEPFSQEWRRLLEGVREYERSPAAAAASELRGRLAAEHRNAAAALERRGKTEEARIHLQKAQELGGP